MISGDDIHAMDDDGHMSRPVLQDGNSLLGLKNIIKALEGHLEHSARSLSTAWRRDAARIYRG